MCTVSFVASNGKIIITSNRDEQVIRPAIAPQKYTINNKTLLFPKDPKAGGTWYVVDENAVSCSIPERNKTVLVSCGSGHDGHYMMHATLRAMPFSKMAFMEWHYVLGPRMQPLQKTQFNNTVNEVLDKNPDLKIVIHDQLPQFPKFLSSAAFSISLAGYNTTMEVLVSNTPSVLIPKFTEHSGKITKIEGEQWERLLLMKEKRMANIAHPKEVLKPEKFADILDCAYANGTAVNKLNINGISNTAELMKDLLPANKEFSLQKEKAYESIHSGLESHCTIPNSLPAWWNNTGKLITQW